MLGVIARAGGPSSLLSLEPDVFVALLEGVVREDPYSAARLDDLYVEAATENLPAAPVDPAERRNEIDRVRRLFG